MYTSVRFTIFHSLRIHEFCEVTALASFRDDDKSIFAKLTDKRRVTGNVRKTANVEVRF